MSTSSPFTCPITLQTMKDPVLAPDGHTYEKKAIEDWLRRHGTSPQTRQRMRIHELVPNRALRDILEQQHSNPNAAVAAAIETAVPVGTVSSIAAIPPPRPKFKPLACSDELYQTILSTTKATTHILNPQTIIDPQAPKQSIINIQTPNITDTSLSSHICCVIDISGSMAAEAKCKDEYGKLNRTGLTILDIVKFSTLVISKSLTAKDQLSIVTYSTNANIVLEPTNMDEEGKKEVERVLGRIEPENMTNLWDGMKLGIELCNNEDYVHSIFVLTDGIPNVHPPLGYERSLKKLLQKQSDDNDVDGDTAGENEGSPGASFFGTISTFGFGYHLDSVLLSNIANVGKGNFSFIPDAGFVGTCFINAVANARCIFGINPYVKVTAKNNVRIAAEEGERWMKLSQYHAVQVYDNEVRILLNPLRYGAPVDVFMNHNNGADCHIDDLDMELVFSVVGGKQVKLPVLTNSSNNTSKEDTFHQIRDQFITNGKYVTAMKYTMRNQSKFLLQLTEEEITNLRDNNPSLDALYKDMEGQATEAISSRDYYESWGRHYLFSLVNAHLHQYCINFKDPGVQIYGKGKLFQKLQEDLNDIFEKVPAPTPNPNLHRYRYGNSSRSSASKMKKGSTTALSMASTFNNSNAVCFHGKTRVTIRCDNQLDGQASIPISQVKKGDWVLTEDNTFVQVQCLVETITKTPLTLVKIKSLEVTPYHPIKLNQGSAWEFPIDCVCRNGEEKLIITSDSHSVFNLVLEKGNRHKAVMMENDIACITLGHGIDTNDVLKHEYFGTDSIVHDLERMSSGEWDEGHVVLNEENIHRDEFAGTINCISNETLTQQATVVCMN